MQHLSQQELDALFEPVNYLGVTGAFVDRVLARHQRRDAAQEKAF
jgi:adenylosuccinate lyase